MYLSYHGCDPGVERRTCLILSSKQEAPVEKKKGCSVLRTVSTCVEDITFEATLEQFFSIISIS